MTPEQILFQGRAERAIFPGTQGTFEVGPFHRPLVSRLKSGYVVVDQQTFPICQGVVRVEKNRIVSLVEVEVSHE